MDGSGIGSVDGSVERRSYWPMSQPGIVGGIAQEKGWAGLEIHGLLSSFLESSCGRRQSSYRVGVECLTLHGLPQLLLRIDWMHGQLTPSRVTTDWDTLEACQPISELTEDPADHHHPPIPLPIRHSCSWTQKSSSSPPSVTLLSTDRIQHFSQAIQPSQ